MTDSEFLKRCDAFPSGIGDYPLYASKIDKASNKVIAVELDTKTRAIIGREHLRGWLIEKGCGIDMQKAGVLIGTSVDFDDDDTVFLARKDENAALVAAVEVVLEQCDD